MKTAYDDRLYHTEAERREAKRYLKEQNQKYGPDLVEITRPEWPTNQPLDVIKVFRSRHFLVQIYEEPTHPEIVVRIGVNRTELAGQRWRDGITWDDLQRLKSQAGYANHWAVEIYPEEQQLVNAANIRHLWVLATPPPYAWHSA